MFRRADRELRVDAIGRLFGWADIRKEVQEIENQSLIGERGIRTPGTVIPYGSLANCWFQPLTHLTLTEILLPGILLASRTSRLLWIYPEVPKYGISGTGGQS